jgi:hypothetical protein
LATRVAHQKIILLARVRAPTVASAFATKVAHQKIVLAVRLRAPTVASAFCATVKSRALKIIAARLFRLSM